MKKLASLLLTMMLCVSMLVPQMLIPMESFAAVGTEVAEGADEAGASDGAVNAGSTEGTDTAGTIDGSEEVDGAEGSDVLGDSDMAEGRNTEDTSGEAAGTDSPEDEEGEEIHGNADVTESPNAEEVPGDADTMENRNVADTLGDAVEAGTSDDAEENDEAGEAGKIEDPWSPIKFKGLYDAGALVLPESMTAPVSEDDPTPSVTVTDTKYSEGILLEGTAGVLASGKIEIADTLDFGEENLSRIIFDGLADRGVTITAGIYLDDEETPVAQTVLKRQMGKKEWANAGDKTIDAGELSVTGQHKVSIGFTIEGVKPTKNTAIALRSITFCKGTLPVMYFNIDETQGTVEAMNNSPDHSVECYGTADLIVPDEFNADETFRDEYGVQETVKGLKLEYIRGRGNSTWDGDKKPYKVKFDKKQNFFGFGANKHWTLIANRYDNSLVRNRMTYWLGAQLGLEYTPQCVPIEVVMNGEYYGSYLLCEQIRVGEGRVSIDDLDDLKDTPVLTDDLIKTGGYLLSMDYDDEETERFWQTGKEMHFFIESPDENLRPEFTEYIKGYVGQIEKALYGKNFCTPEGVRYDEYLDLDAAADYWWVQEFSCNGDAYSSGSTYLYKKRDPDENNIGKLYWGPLWDFDYVAWGDLDYDEESAPETLTYTGNPWSVMMLRDPKFVGLVKDRWDKGEEGQKSYRELINEIVRKGGLLDRYKEQMEVSYKYDHAKYGPFESEFTNYSDEIEQLRNWIIDRTDRFDEALDELDLSDHTVKFMVNGKIIKTITVPGGFPIGKMPTAPAKKGYTFAGWYSDEAGYCDEETCPVKNLVLKADYLKNSEVIEPKNIYFSSKDVYLPVDSDFDFAYETEYRVMPDDAISRDITWKSSNTSVATVEKGGYVYPVGFGTTIITATLSNGVKNSYKIHVVDFEQFEMNEVETVEIKESKVTLKQGGYTQLTKVIGPQPCDGWSLFWLSTNEDVITVDQYGIVEAVAPGTASVILFDTNGMMYDTCMVTVTGNGGNKKQSLLGKTVTIKGSKYKITADKAGNRTAAFIKAKNAKKVTVPATIKTGGKVFKVTEIRAKAFKGKKIRNVIIGKNVRRIKAKAFSGCKAAKMTVKTKLLKKAAVKKALKGSKIKTVKVKVGKKKINKKYVKKYKKIFTKKNAGRKVTVK